MRVPLRSGNVRISNETMRLIITTFGGVIFGFFLGIISPKLSSTKINLTYIESKYHGLSTQALFDALNPLKANKVGSNKAKGAKIWTPTNPKGAETLPPGIVSSRSDIYPRRLWGHPDEDLTIKPKYLVAFTVGYNQKHNIDAAVKKFSNNFTIVLFHYDGVTSEWDEFEWSKRAIHVSAPKQSKWWFAKRFLHPDIVAPYDYIFIWDEDLGVEHFNAEEYIKIVRKHGLEISQPGLDPDSIGLTWAMTMKRNDTEIHTRTQERTGWCTDLHLPPCAAFVEIMATVFSRNAWRCVWHMIQNDLVHGWGLDFYLRRCVETPHEKIGVVDVQWIVHQGIPSLRNQTFSMGQEDIGLAPWKGVRERCKKEWSMFQNRMTDAEKAYYESMGISTTDLTYGMDPSDF
ncbi:copii coat assembly sec16 [Gossypium australe]|uniref:Copii coat assembly sec16 n=1 Tax=Gossypium australe TaxID=47621 RepID=A0A5B6URI2_9ROSI|nr:copii coat assembly sec16 [Gossypium australe]